MIRGLATLAVAAAMASGAAAQPPQDKPTLPVDGVITNPDWERRPTGEEMARYFPQLAQTFQLTGNAVIQCKVTAGGTVEGCRTISEAPTGFGFGLAAVRLSSVFRMKPRMVDGAPVGGATVNIPIAFRLSPEAPLPATVTASATVAPTPEGLALARRLVAARSMAEGYAAAFQRLGAQVGAVAANGGTPGERAAAQTLASELQRTMVAYAPRYLEDQAAAYASRLTVDQLKEIVAFYESPTGRTWTTAQQPAEQEAMRRTTLAVTKAVGEAYCAQRDCPTGLPAGPTQARAGPTALPIER